MHLARLVEWRTRVFSWVMQQHEHHPTRLIIIIMVVVVVVVMAASMDLWVDETLEPTNRSVGRSVGLMRHSFD